MRRTTTYFLLLACAALTLPACGGSSSSTPAPPPPAPVPTVDIIATSRNGDAILMFKDILNNHPVVGADVVIDNTGPTTLDNHGRLAYENGWLAVNGNDDNNVVVYGDVQNLTSQQVPNAILSIPSTGRGCCLSGGDLYVLTGNELHIWRDVTTVANADPADAIITGFNQPVDCLVYMDALFVGERSGDAFHRFDGASTLASGVAAPDATVVYNDVRRLYVHQGTLWVCDDNDNSFTAGYDDPLNLTAATQPDQVIFGAIQIDGRRSMAFSGDLAFIANKNTQNDVVFNVVDLNNPVQPKAAIKDNEIAFEDAYDVKLIGGVLFLHADDTPAVYWYLNPDSIVSGQSPDGFVFDARLDDGKMITGWVRP